MGLIAWARCLVHSAYWQRQLLILFWMVWETGCTETFLIASSAKQVSNICWRAYGVLKLCSGVIGSLCARACARGCARACAVCRRPNLGPSALAWTMPIRGCMAGIKTPGGPQADFCGCVLCLRGYAPEGCPGLSATRRPLDGGRFGRDGGCAMRRRGRPMAMRPPQRLSSW